MDVDSFGCPMLGLGDNVPLGTTASFERSEIFLSGRATRRKFLHDGVGPSGSINNGRRQTDISRPAIHPSWLECLSGICRRFTQSVYSAAQEEDGIEI